MCITVSPAEMHNTKVYAGISSLDNKDVHVLCYSNKVKSKSPNAMILPIPTQSLTKQNIIDTTNFSNFLDIISKNSFHKTKGFSKGFSDELLLSSRRSIEVFESGSYSCIIADNANDISKVFHLLPEKKRPTIKDELISFFADNYPDNKWKFLCCCWEGQIEPEPIMIYYTPSNPEVVYLPMLDSHDGSAPKDQIVKTDHTVMFGLSNTEDNITYYNNLIPDKVKSLLPTTSIGKHIPRVKNNGDLYVESKVLKNVRFDKSSKFDVYNCFPKKQISNSILFDGNEE